jgi:hypothetical protein
MRDGEWCCVCGTSWMVVKMRAKAPASESRVVMTESEPVDLFW